MTQSSSTDRSRNQAKGKKPKFARHESWRYVRLKENWRRPRGLDNKMRIRFKGWPPRASAGYRSPKMGRGLHPSGLEKVLVHNPEQLREIDRKTQAVQIAHTVGKRKRIRILADARKRKLAVLNIKAVKVAEEEPKEEVKEEIKEKPEPPEAEKPKEEAEPKKGKRRTKGQ